MDVMGIAKLSTSLADTGLKQDVGIAVLKRAEDIQASTATQLLDAVQSAAPAQNLPSHLGQHVNTTA
jgi:hypothetical protein